METKSANTYPTPEVSLETYGVGSVAYVEKGLATAPKTADEPYLLRMLSTHQRVWYRIQVGVWVATLVGFWSWWLNVDHVISWGGFILNSTLFFWTFVIPAYFFFFVGRMRRVNDAITIPEEWRIAMITTRAPSEPFSVVKRTLLAMLSQKHPHDTWLADEDPTEEILQWCAFHHVKVCTRRGIAQYHRDSWPRRTRCKEGNLAYFYDHIGYDNYDFVVQLDADHRPAPGYLEEMLRPFVNDDIGYVSAPSVCDANASKSWSTRGRLHAEAILHGPLQAGYTGGWAPLCIGSHYAVRTKALKEIGGLGPELAEDHSTTLMMNAHGWRGAHAINAHARGDGPMTLADCITQEFQWSRSLAVILFTEMPKYWSRLTLKLKFQFLFSELWFPLFGLMMLLGFSLPIAAVMGGFAWVEVSYIDFLVHSIPITLSVTGVVWFLKQSGCLRPAYAPIISWEGILFQLIRWPWALFGTVMGLVAVMRNKQTAFRVTPKEVGAQPPLNWRLLSPYFAIVGISFLVSVLVPDAGSASGYHFFLITNVITYVIALIAIVRLHNHESDRLAKET